MWCSDLLPELQHTACHSYASSQVVSVCLVAIFGCLPLALAVVLVLVPVLSNCLMPSSKEHCTPCLASRYNVPPSVLLQTYYQTPPPTFSFRQRAFHKSVVYLWVLCR